MSVEPRGEGNFEWLFYSYKCGGEQQLVIYVSIHFFCHQLPVISKGIINNQIKLKNIYGVFGEKYNELQGVHLKSKRRDILPFVFVLFFFQ